MKVTAGIFAPYKQSGKIEIIPFRYLDYEWLLASSGTSMSAPSLGPKVALGLGCLPQPILRPDQPDHVEATTQT